MKKSLRKTTKQMVGKWQLSIPEKTKYWILDKHTTNLPYLKQGAKLTQHLFDVKFRH